MSEAADPNIPKPESLGNKPWGNVTDPAHHDDGHFRYLIHLDSGRRGDSEESWGYLLDDPAKIASLPYLSASLVDESHRVLYQGTNSNHGFIIEAPPEAIIAAHPHDIFSRSKDPDVLRAEFPPPDPDALLADTETTDWNEIAVAGSGITIKAIFWTPVEHDDEPPFSKEVMQHVADQLGVPCLELDLVKH